MGKLRAPSGLGSGGRRLWSEVTELHDLDVMQQVQLEEACRAKDRLDRMDLLLRGEASSWMELVPDRDDDAVLTLQISSALSKANETANLMKQLIAALRLPDEVTGKRPQQRGPRGAQAPSVPGGRGTVTALERARRRSAG